MRVAVLALLVACAGPPEDTVDPCDGDGDLATCAARTKDDAFYVDQAQTYFDSLDDRVEAGTFPAYAEQVIRWEWPPWLKLTGFGRDVLEGGDLLFRAYAATIDDRDCRAFGTQPFARCRVVFHYEAHEGRPCPIYEEFTFADTGEVTFVEAWSDQPSLRPTTDDDPWAERPAAPRLSTRVPGLGDAGGAIDLDGDAMAAAADADADVADLVARAHDFFGTWTEAQAEAGDDLWTVGCGW